MAAFILPDDDSGRIVTFDVIESELHETVTEVTAHPVEQGVEISDHVRPLPDRVSFQAYTSNQPIVSNPFTQRGELTNFKLEVPPYFPEPSELALNPGAALRFGVQAGINALFGPPEFNAQVLAFSEAFNAIVETYETLLELQKNGVLLQIVTPIRIYEDMVLERVAAPRTAGDSGVAFGLDMRQIRVVESSTVAAPPIPAIPAGVPEQAKGSQGAKPPVDDEENPASRAQSILISLGAGDILGIPPAGS